MKTAILLIGLILIIGCEKANTPPVANFTYTPDAGTTDTVFMFDAISSTDAEEGTTTLQVHWDWTNDGIWDTDYSSNKTINHQYDEVGDFTVILEIKDSKGIVTSTSHTIKVGASTRNTFIDQRDNRRYKWVQIGSQEWMAENLAYLPSVSTSSNCSETAPFNYVYGYEGTSISEAKSNANYTTYGVIYNWSAAMNGSSSSTTVPSGVQGICPDGWHLPSDAEWTILTDYLSYNGYGFGGSGQDIGKSMATTSGWTSFSSAGTVGNDQASNNSSGFTALPGGECSYGLWFNLGDRANFWSSSGNGSSFALYPYLDFSSDVVCRNSISRSVGISVRCLKN